MPFQYQYLADVNCLVEVGSGRVSLQDFLDYHRELKINNPLPALRILADYRDADLSDLSTDDIQQIRLSALKKLEGKYDTAKEAIVVSNELAFGLSRMFDGLVYSENYELDVFTDIRKAKAWLGLDPDLSLELPAG